MLIPQFIAWKDEMTAWRRHLHRNPETAFEEIETARFVAQRLEDLGLEVHSGLAETGVVGILRAGDSAAAIGLRADMDALHLQELNEFEHRSVVPEKMHACGHDGHTAMLLGAARYLAATRAFSGTVYFIFQPAEENEGGGRRMVEEGLFERFRMDAVFGMHNMPGLDVGRFTVLPGPMLASFDVFEIEVVGRGAHAALPQLGVDALLAASNIVNSLQSVVSRNIDPLDSAVVSATQIHAGETWNVCPERAVIRGTVRTFTEPVRSLVEKRIGDLSRHVAEAFGATANVRYDRRYPATNNDPVQTARVRQVIEGVFGSEALTKNSRPLMASEDFAYMLQAKAGCYVLLGNGAGEGSCSVHNPRYDFNDDAIPFGATYWARLVETLLAAGPAQAPER